MTTETTRYVGFWKRFGATIVDTILLSLITLPATIAFYGWGYFDAEQTNIVAGPVDFVISWVVPIFIVLGFWIWKQATPGKMLFRARILDAKTGGIPTTRQWILRYLGYFISMIPLCLGYFWVAFDKRKQAWHDKIAGTVVIHPDRD